MDSRLSREQAFHDERFAEGSARPADRFYSINAASTACFETWIDRLAPGTTLLDYGCGEGAFVAKHAAAMGHQVTAIDLSPVAVQRAAKDIEALGYADRVAFHVGDAEDTPFEAASFDAICGLGVVHHLDLDRSWAELARLMRPGGRGLFIEPMGHNPLINLYRRATPSQRSADEHPLLQKDLDAVSRYFGGVQTTHFHLLDLLALPVPRGPRLDALLRRTAAADRTIFRTVPQARRMAWMVAIEVSEPRPL